MRRISISISDEMVAYAAGQVEKGRFATIDAFIETLIRYDHAERPLTLRELHERLDEAEASGISDRTVSDIIEATEAELRRGDRL